ncbi:class I SAM-dependent methyltransferase [Aureitalea sp. L0-47]|uniref:class I SAM-dependent methyltransferase n=1 Tax=Aureitalea sp. L0-47 TaxID=2816962 RepID=UPI00223765B3|nr:class I SAM-dependent methyltransferase [Aureitalea sp. L0-47]MCW5520742.1 class I SAM-dependent methyltransferase [Aureitalea sp. L0-47]
MQNPKELWYTSWFDTPYYHILYKDRDEEEAGLFMRNLTAFLNLDPGSEILDLACGKGRHARYLSDLGYKVTGVDLSENNIAKARQFENERLQFKVHDMCVPYPGKFDAVFNLFTSFGYFEKEGDNLRTITAIRDALKPSGYGVIDFLNVQKTIPELVPSEEKFIDGIHFKVDRKYEDGYLVKRIEFEVNGDGMQFHERVKALSLDDFQHYFIQAGVKMIRSFGCYHLSDFDVNSSERLILIFGK